MKDLDDVGNFYFGSNPPKFKELNTVLACLTPSDAIAQIQTDLGDGLTAHAKRVVQRILNRAPGSGYNGIIHVRETLEFFLQYLPQIAKNPGGLGAGPPPPWQG
jgi:hypothetical protein